MKAKNQDTVKFREIEPGPALDRWLCERLGIAPMGYGVTSGRPSYHELSTTLNGMGVLLEALDARHNVVIHRTSGWNSVTVRVCHRHDGKRGDAGDANLPQAVALAARAALGDPDG